MALYSLTQPHFLLDFMCNIGIHVNGYSSRLNIFVPDANTISLAANLTSTAFGNDDPHGTQSSTFSLEAIAEMLNFPEDVVDSLRSVSIRAFSSHACSLCHFLCLVTFN